MKDLVREARALGAAIVVVHGETLTEPVEEGTNRAGIEAGADIIAHPGLIHPEDVALARDRGVVLEITTRRGHSISNGYVAREAVRQGALLTINTDAHAPGDLVSRETAYMTLLAAGLDPDQVELVFRNAGELVEKALRRIHA
jgi:histidinol phosphatase-like PHP family hydrolase